MLPLNPTELYHGNSPYHSTSAFACNPLFISPELLVKDGLITEADLESAPEFPKDRVDYPSVVAYKEKLFEGAYERFKRKEEVHEYEQFCMQNTEWLDDFALFVALRSRFQGKAWSEWPQEIRDREPDALESAKRELYGRLDRTRFLQYIFFRQWISLKKYCNERGVQILGDIPIYVNYDSADLWTHPELFKLDHDKRPYAVAGVPPDYFSETGQLWGNPIYRWDVLKERGYDWWIQRMKQNFKFFDLVRIDHFRGFVAYWEVPANEKTAKNGKWVEAPAEDFFKVLLEKFPAAPLIAEDLGVITPEVREIMQRFEFPGMKVLLFAFGEDLPTNPYAPHNVVQNCLIYTGTHDNNTARGWFENEATPEEKKKLFLYLGREITGGEVHGELIRLAMTSVANTVIIPMQDILGLGEEARMNRPSTKEGNWQWRLLQEAVTPDLAGRLLEMTEIYGRA
jgi:4-alpha-glucanotransferase